MKRLILFCLVLGITLPLAAQKNSDQGDDKPLMQPKVYNFYTFTPEVKMDVSKDPKLFPDSLREHPEFGVLPYNTQCKNCYEEIGKRTAYSRHFVEPGTNGKHHYSQKSFFPLHYKNKDGFWVTLDHRMKPLKQGYTTIAYPTQHSYNPASNFTGITTSKGWLEFNSQLDCYFVDANGQNTSLSPIALTGETKGSDGVQITNAWPNVTIQHIFKREGIKTNFVLHQKPNIPNGVKYMVFEQLIIPHLYQASSNQIAYASNGSYTTDGLFVGDINITNTTGDILFQIHEAKYYDGYGYGTSGRYKLTQHQTPPSWSALYREYYTLQIYVPVSYLNDPNLRYPVYIDPLVEGKDSLGRFSQADPQNNFGANMGFSNMPLTCNFQLEVEVPGMSDIQDTYIDIEYENTFSATCGTPPLQPPFCQFSDVRMEVRSVECGTTTGQLTCDPAAPPFIGTCTTDPNLVPGASALRYPGYLACIPPQCPNYFLNFELRNMEMQCDGDVCGYNCARGHYWAVTIEALTIENVITLSRDTICAGDTVSLTAYPEWGVPPYRYEWSDGQTDSIITVTTETDLFISCTAFDFCDNPAVPQDIFITALPSPTADAGDTARLCEGGSANLGGSPTSSGFAPTYNWTAEPPAAASFLTAPGSANPIANIPAGTLDTILYIVRVTDQGCFRRDTVVVYSGANPVPVVVPDTAYICPGEGATFNTTQPFVSYNWSDGSTNAELTTFDIDNFDVVVTDGNGCTGTSNSVTTLRPNLPTFDLFATPDSAFNLGESAALGATINLEAPPVDSFSWGPAVNINCLDCPDPVVTPVNDQFYVLEVYSQGCRLLDSIFINVTFPNTYWIPRAFTPNQDGLNDRFYIIKESGVTVTDFKIFNRWGQLIYDNVFPWDGSSKGQPVDMGVYSFIFTLRLSDGKEVIESGQVTVVK